MSNGMINDFNLKIFAIFLTGVIVGMPLGLLLLLVMFKKMIREAIKTLFVPLIERMLSKERDIQRAKDFLKWKVLGDFDELIKKVKENLG